MIGPLLNKLRAFLLRDFVRTTITATAHNDDSASPAAGVLTGGILLAHPDGSFHPGIDLAAPAGTAVLAATSGTVSYAGLETGYGNYICLAATATFSTCYAHLATILVTVGQTVTQAQPLGTEGATGDATGPHLHFEVRLRGQTEDPAPYLPAG